MLNKIKNKPLWYKLWSLSVAISAIYYLVVYFFFEPSKTDQFIEAYALISIVLDYILFPSESKQKNTIS